VVDEAIDHCGRDGGVPEHLAPTPERLVGGHDHGSALVAGGHELEAQVGGLGLERYVANLVDDQKGDAAKLMFPRACSTTLRTTATRSGAVIPGYAGQEVGVRYSYIEAAAVEE
jgi:hypothetical protein